MTCTTHHHACEWQARAEKAERMLKEATRLLYRSKCQQELMYSSKWEDDFDAFLEESKK